LDPSPSAEFAAEEVSRRKNLRKTDVNEKFVAFLSLALTHIQPNEIRLK
jgi:hypothetical protein